MKTQESITKTSPISLLSENQSCPLKLKVEYEDGKLNFEWDCANVKCAEGSYFRQVLIIDTESYDTLDQIFNIVKIFYKKLKLGDFMKILFTNQRNSNAWIQKTSQKIRKQDIIMPKTCNVNLCTIVQTAIKLTKKFQQPASISIFTKKSINQQDQICNNISQLNYNKNCCCLISVFQEVSSQKIRHSTIYIDQFYHFLYRDHNQLEGKLKSFCNQQNKIRVIQAEIKLTCVNGEMFMRNSCSESWMLERDTLTRKMYGLNNYTRYCCPLQINTFRLNKVGFQLQFYFTFVGGDKYKMKQIFYLSIENSAKTIQEVNTNMCSSFRPINYSLLPKQLTVSEARRQHVMIKEKISGQYLSYQKQFFD